MSILGPPTAMVPAPVFSRAKSLRAKMRNMYPYMSQMSTEQQHASRYIYSSGSREVEGGSAYKANSC
jgi:hypothetical protein